MFMNVSSLKNFAQKILGLSTVQTILRKSRRVTYWVVSSFWPVRILFFSILNQGFLIEQRAVSSGVSRYNRSSQATSPELRRNIHRLEKGLTTKNRRKEFGLAFIGETVEEFIRKKDSLNETEKAWSLSVLKQYFGSVTSSDKRFARAKMKFSELIETSTIPRDDLGPFIRPPFSAVAYEDLLGLAYSRRSVRYFLDEPVDPDDIQKAVRLAAQSPSSCNRLPFRLIISEGPKSAKEMLSLPFGASGWGESAPVAVAVVGDFSSFFSPRDRHSAYTDASLFVMSFCLALETLGLSSTIVNWPELAIQDIRAKRVLKLQSHEKIVMFIALGHPDPLAKVPRSAKKAPDSFIETRRD